MRVPAGQPSSPHSNSRCSPRQIPRNGAPAATAARMASACPISFMVAMASANAPTPGKTMPSALRMAAASSVMTALKPASDSPRCTEARFPLW